MKCIFRFGLLLVVGGCSGTATERPTPDGAGAADASHGAVRADAADGMDAGADAEAEADADTSDGRSTCPAAIDDAGFTSLSDLPIAALCTEGNGRVVEWTNSCEGSVAVVQGDGVDCQNVWLFDATTHALQATAFGCLRLSCTGGVPGFAFPTTCFDGSFVPELESLCTDASAPDAN
jgi:hypothetical protein